MYQNGISKSEQIMTKFFILISRLLKMLLFDKYTKKHSCFYIARQIVWVRCEKGYSETEGRVKSFLVTNECNLSCDIKMMNLYILVLIFS